MMVFRRWRHLFTFLASILVMQLVGLQLYEAFSRPRPYDVTTIGRWAGFSSPSPPVVVLSSILVAVVYSMVPAGRGRHLAKWIVAAVLATFVAARLYLAVDHPFDAVCALVIGITFPLGAFRLFTPNAYVPVTYGRGKTAHLDVGGRRGEAIVAAVRDGRIPRARIDEANRRLDALARQFARPAGERLSALGVPEHHALAAGLARIASGPDPTETVG
jgi:hypothetical protein